MKRIFILSVIAFCFLVESNAIAQVHSIQGNVWVSSGEPCFDKVIETRREVIYISDDVKTVLLISLLILSVASIIITITVSSNRTDIIKRRDENSHIVNMAEAGYEQITYPGCDDWFWQKVK